MVVFVKVCNVLNCSDRLFDYTPGISSLKSLFDIFQKTVVVPNKNLNSCYDKRYFERLSEKSFYRCIILLIPVIGNISVGIYDFLFRNYDQKEFVLNEILTGENIENVLYHASKQLRDDKEVVLAAVHKNYNALKYASERLRDEEDVVLAAGQGNKIYDFLGYECGNFSVKYASERLKDNQKIALVFVERTPETLGLLGKQSRANKKVVLSAVSQRGSLVRFASAELQDDDDVAYAACCRKGAFYCGDPSPLQFLSQRLRARKGVGLLAVKESPWSLFLLSKELQEDEEILLIAVEGNGHILRDLPVKWENNKDFLLKVARKSFMGAFYASKYAGESLQNDRQFILEMAHLDGCSISRAKKIFSSDREICLAAAASASGVEKYIDRDLWKDRTFVLDFLDQAKEPSIHSFKHFLSRKFLDDDEMMKKAIEKQALSEIDVSRRLQKKWALEREGKRQQIGSFR